MDYWNADGSFAEMCGNGVRVFVRYLVDGAWPRPARRACRWRPGAGVVRARVGDRISVQHASPRVYAASTATVGR
jgi:diaminopimelate epimerase